MSSSVVVSLVLGKSGEKKRRISVVYISLTSSRADEKEGKKNNRPTKFQLLQIVTGYGRLSQIITDIKISLHAKCN